MTTTTTTIKTTTTTDLTQTLAETLTACGGANPIAAAEIFEALVDACMDAVETEDQMRNYGALLGALRRAIDSELLTLTSDGLL